MEVPGGRIVLKIKDNISVYSGVICFSCRNVTSIYLFKVNLCSSSAHLFSFADVLHTPIAQHLYVFYFAFAGSHDTNVLMLELSFR